MTERDTSVGGPIIGVDLGTTNSLAAYADERGPRVLREPPAHDDAAEGESPDLLPSVVRYAADGGGVEAVGHEARRSAVRHPERTISSVKRLMGRSRADAAADLPFLSYAVEDGANRTARVRIGDRLISPQEVSAAILRRLRERASRALGVEVSRAVITVPAYFDDAQRQATRDAGRLAGLEAVRIVNEPTAAALAYGVGLRLSAPQTIAVYDLGGGTFDVTILRVTPASANGSGAEPAFFEVLSTAGDTRLGGDDVDQMIVSLALREIRAGFGGDLEFPPATRQALRTFAEAVKIRLSSAERAAMRIDLGEGRVYERAVTREELEALMSPWVERTIACCRRAMRDARVTPAEIGTVVLVGGSTRVPMVRRRVAEEFGREPYTALNPELVVALGAAVQASILAGATTSALLLDVIPLSLGVETVGGGVAKVIVRNQMVPARAVEMFSTSVDGQTSIRLNIVQGEREMARDCRSLGVFDLGGIPPMPAGMPQVEVEFLVDANGVLSVHARERRSGKRASLQVVPNHGLTREEVERMEAEAFAHAREDMARHRIADLVVNSRLDLKWVEDALGRVRGALEPGYVAELEAASARLRRLADAGERDWRAVDANEFHAAKEALDRASVRMHEAAITASLRGGE